MVEAEILTSIAVAIIGVNSAWSLAIMKKLLDHERRIAKVEAVMNKVFNMLNNEVNKREGRSIR